MSKDFGFSFIYTAFFSLLRSGLWNIPADEKLFPLSAGQWSELLGISRKQTVEGLVYDGIMTLSADLQPPRSILLQWLVALDKIEHQNRQMSKRIAELFPFLESQNLKTYLVKGHSVSCCYVHPEHRSCGDVDVYFSSREELKQSIALLEQKGIVVKNMPGFSLEYIWKDVLVEHHANMLDVHNPFLKKYVQKLIDQEEKKSVRISIGGQNILSPSPLLSVLLVNLHILKHTLSFGIGLRQLCDSARIYYAYHEQLDGEELKKIYRRLGVLRWVQVLHQVLVQYLGLEAEYLPFALDKKDDPSWMINEVMEGGNFGFADTRFGRSADANQKRENAFRHVFHRFCLNYRFAPGETFFFPLVQLYSRKARI